MSVGASHRSAWKHELLDRFVGKVTGVACTSRYQQMFNLDSQWYFDLTAGNGAENPHSGTSSPDIFTKHQRWAQTRGVPTTVVFVERRAATFAQLRARLADEPNVIVIHGDAGTPGLLPVPPPRASVFIHIDGNSVNQNPDIRLLRTMPDHTLSLITLGCNAHGIRGMLNSDPDLIDRWRDQVLFPVQQMRNRHDALLIAPDADGHKWGYLIVAPRRWHDDIVTIVDRAFTGQRHLRRHWWRTEQREFTSLLVDYLMPDGPGRGALCEQLSLGLT